MTHGDDAGHLGVEEAPHPPEHHQTHQRGDSQEGQLVLRGERILEETERAS